MPLSERFYVFVFCLMSYVFLSECAKYCRFRENSLGVGVAMCHTGPLEMSRLPPNRPILDPIWMVFDE
jgi:hypothetical protein